MKKRVLLTGATGFVGKQVLARLLKADIDIRLVLRSGSASKIKHSVNDLVWTDDLFAQDRSWWQEVCQDVHTVIHSAWYTEPGKYIQSVKNFECLSGTLEMAVGAAGAGVKRFVGVGSCSEYDMSAGYLSIQTALQPTTIYGAAKAATFMALSQYFTQMKIDFSWCRLFYLYGEDEDSRRFVPYLRHQLTNGLTAELTSGKQIRDYLDVTLAGAEIAEIALTNVSGPRNICSSKPLSIRELAEEIADEYGRRDLLRFGMRPDNDFDPPCIVGMKD